MKFFEKLKGSPKFACSLGDAMIIGGVVVTAIGLRLNVMWLAVIGLAAMLLGIAAKLIYWRCPKCGRMLPIRSVTGMEFCPYCGEELF